MLEIDGSEESGSGTIFRTSLVLSALLGEKIHIVNIRKKRPEPGLRPQHLKVLQACQMMTEAIVKGDFVGSEEIFFEPKKNFQGKDLELDIASAGSTTMLAQALLPIALFGKIPSRFTLKGGVFQEFAPSGRHLQYVLLPILYKMGARAQLDIVRPGYVPQGGGEIQLKVEPLHTLTSIELLQRGEIKAIKGFSLSSHLKSKLVSQRMAKSAEHFLKKVRGLKEFQIIEDETAIQSGACLTLILETTSGLILGADIVGKMNLSSEKIGKMAAEQLLQDWERGATVDRFIADQLILYAALADKKSSYKIPFSTEHISANLWVIKKILKVQALLSNQILEIEGIGFFKK